MLFRHYRTETNGCLTVAYENTDGLAQIGISWCSPNDKFSRRKGRLIASRRLETGRDNGHYVDKDLHGRELSVRACIFELLEDAKKPRWYDSFRQDVEERWKNGVEK